RFEGGPVRQPVLEREHDQAQLRHRTAFGLKINWFRVQQCTPRRNYQQGPAPDVRALLIPQRQLARELRVLIDSRLDLQRSVNQFRLGKVVDHRGAVLRAVAASRNPANQVIPVGGREWENFYELYT